MADTLHFERYEFKYFVPNDRLAEVRKFIRPYVQPDKHAAKNGTGRYTIQNIYLDTPGLDFFHDGVNGAPDRVKLRIRWYGDEAEEPFFFEVKRKIRRVIVKDRVRITRREFDAIVADGPLSLPDGPTRERLLNFADRATYSGAVPTVLVRYERDPFESVFGEYARITFDRAMCFQQARDFQIPGNPRGWTYVDAPWATGGIPNAAVLELKFTNEYPRWMSDLVSNFELERMGFSKYGSSIVHWTEGDIAMVEDSRRAMGWR